MSIKSKVLATAASLTMVGGVLAVSTLATATAAKAETPSCGAFNFFCVDLFSKQFGTHKDPGFIQDVYRQGNRVGQPIILFRVSSSDPAEDFTTDDLVNPLNTFLPYTVAAAPGAFRGHSLHGHHGEPVRELLRGGERVRAVRREQRPVRGHRGHAVQRRGRHAAAVRYHREDAVDHQLQQPDLQPTSTGTPR